MSYTTQPSVLLAEVDTPYLRGSAVVARASTTKPTPCFCERYKFGRRRWDPDTQLLRKGSSQGQDCWRIRSGVEQHTLLAWQGSLRNAIQTFMKHIADAPSDVALQPSVALFLPLFRSHISPPFPCRYRIFQCEYTEAKALCACAMNILEKTLGLDHPQVSRGLITWASLLGETVSARESQ